jgi:hypothetical protein
MIIGCERRGVGNRGDLNIRYHVPRQGDYCSKPSGGRA